MAASAAVAVEEAERAGAEWAKVGRVVAESDVTVKKYQKNNMGKAK